MPESIAATISFGVNGRDMTVTCAPFRRLLDVLREDLSLTGSKEGCGEGECGACSVILNGEIMNSCIVPVIQAQGSSIRTVESVRETPLGAAIQKAFSEHGGAQCGICTPGMIVTALWLLENRAHLPAGAFQATESAAPARPDLRQLMAGNLCRCTGYDLIVESIEAAIAEAGGAGAAGDAGEAGAAGDVRG